MQFRNISAWSIRNPVLPLVLFTAVFLAGLMAFSKMDIVNTPDIEFPGVTVSIAQPGAAPTEIETQITQKVESAVRSINGVRNISSTTTEGSSTTFVEFEVGRDVNAAVSEVKNAIDTVRGSLPDAILEPRVNKVEIGAGFLGIFAIEANDMTVEELSWFIDDTVAKKLLAINGLAEVTRFAGVDRQIEVLLDPVKMQALGVTAGQVNQLLRVDNVDAAGGIAEVGGTRQSVRVLGNMKSAFELGQRKILVPGRGTVKLSDFATVKDGYAERTSVSRVNNKEVVNFRIGRAKGASDVTVYNNAVEVMEKIEAENPGIRFIKLITTVKYTEDQYHSSIDAMIDGALLAVAVVFLFLRDWRATIISAIAIPLSAIPTFWFMQLLGFNLNQMSLLALGLVAGVLVDDAIVEIENIVRHMKMGKSAYQASIDAADEIGLAVVATSFCIVAVFLPVGLMPGVTGQFFKNFGLTIVAAVLMSLAVARMITPMFAAYFLKAHGEKPQRDGVWMQRYMAVLRWSLDRSEMEAIRAKLPPIRHRFRYIFALLITLIFIVVVTAMTMFIVYGGGFGFPGIKSLDMPNALASLFAEEHSFAWKIIAKPLEFVLLVFVTVCAFFAMLAVRKGLGFLFGLFGSRTSQSWAYLDARFSDHRVWMMGIGYFALLVTALLFANTPFQFQPEQDESNVQIAIEVVPGTTLATTEEIVDDVAKIVTRSPDVEKALLRARQGGESSIYITLKEDRSKPSYEFERELAPVLAAYPDARVRFQSQGGPGGPGSGRDLSIMLAGSDPTVLLATANQVVEQMGGLKDVVAPRITGDVPRPEIIVRPRYEIASELGVSTMALSQAIRIATLGEIEQNAAKFSLSNRQIPIVVRLPIESRQDLTTLENLPVPTAAGGSVPLSRVAEISFGSGPTTIQRYNLNRRVLIGADLAAGALRGDVMAKIDELPALKDLPSGVIRDVVGEDELQEELVANFGQALVSGILLVFAVLVLLYGRLMSPLVNMCSLALAPLGGIFLVWVVGQPTSMPVLIGILLLLGIVSKNSILLIDFAIESMERGEEKLNAILDAGHKRAQPIVMTTVAMTAGMVPTSLSLGGDGAWRAPMGTVVIGGLILSTLLTLLIVPAGFSLADSFERRVGPWLRDKFLTYKPEAEGNVAAAE